MTSGRLKRSRAATVSEVYNNDASNLDDYEDSNRSLNYDAEVGPPAKKFIGASDSLPGHVNDLAAYAAVLASSSNNQSGNDQLLQNGLIALENPASQMLSSAGFPLYATTSTAQLALLVQKQQQQRNAALAAQCFLPQNLLLNQQLRSATFAQPSMLNAYACPMSVQSLLPQQNQLSATMLSAANSSLINPGSYYEGSPLIMSATSSQPQLMHISNTASPECKVDTSLYYNVFVGDLSPEVTHEMLQKAFEKFGPLIEAKVMIDQSSGKSRSFGFVTFWKQENAAKAIEEMNGQMLGKRAIRTNWATRQKGESRVATYEEILKAGDGSNPSVYLKNVGELTEAEIRENFEKFGTIKQIRLFSSKNYGFVVYETKENAARAILEVSGQKIKGHLITCSWGRQEPAPKTNTVISAVGGLNPASIVAQLPFQSALQQIYQPALLQNWRV